MKQLSQVQDFLRFVGILLSILVLSAVVYSGCDDDNPSSDGTDADTQTADDTLGDIGTDENDSGLTDTGPEEELPDTLDGVDFPPTTLMQTVLPVLSATMQGGNDRTDWGIVDVGPGEAAIFRDDLGVNEPEESDEQRSSSVAYLLHLSDSQISDEESPARLIHGDLMFEAAYRNQESWSSHFLEATVRTCNSFADVLPFDFAVFTGDLVDNIHGNELDWFMTVMDGGLVNPDSGDDDDPIPGSENDPHDPFEADGMHPDVPWFVVVGNHDELILGNFNDLSFMVEDPVGDTASWLSNAVVPTCLEEPFYETESELPERCYLPPKSYYTSKDVIPDPAREFYDKSDLLQAMLDSSSSPDGHGITDENLEINKAFYAKELLDGKVRLIALDTVANEMQDGIIGDFQFDWLVEQLDESEAQGQVAIVTSHHPAMDIKGRNQAFIKELNEHPNVVAHLAGHTHINRIIPRPSDLGSQYGYWEIHTDATVVWPQQTRIIEIVDNNDGTGDIYCTMVDYEIPADMPTLEGGRFYALYDIHSGSKEPGQGTAEDRNVKLRVSWPEEVIDNLASAKYRPVVTNHFDTQ